MKERIHRDLGKGVPNSQCPEGPGGTGNPFRGPTMHRAYTQPPRMVAMHASNKETQPELSRGMAKVSRGKCVIVRDPVI